MATTGEQHHRRTNQRAWLALILLVAVLLRLGAALYLGDDIGAPPLLADQRSYHALAERLLQGHGYSFSEGWYPFTPPDTPTAHWSFLYPLFVAAVYAIAGVHPLAVRLAQAVLGGTLLPWMVYRMAKRWYNGDDRLPLIAAALSAVYGYLVLYAATLMTETLYIILLLFSFDVTLMLGAHLRDGRPVSFWRAAPLGVGLGLAALMRQSILPLVPVLLLWLLWQAWRARRLAHGVRTAAVSVALIAACVLPWTARNYAVYGELLLLNSNSGYAMYSAQHPMHGTRFREFEAAPLPEDLPAMNEAQMDRELMRRGLQFVREDPARYALLCLSRVRAFIEFWPTSDTTLLHNVGRTGSFGVFFFLVLYGLYLVLQKADDTGRSALLIAFTLLYALMHILTWAMVRYRLPIDALMMPVGALALQDLYQRIQRRVRTRQDALATWRLVRNNRSKITE